MPRGTTRSLLTQAWIRYGNKEKLSVSMFSHGCFETPPLFEIGLHYVHGWRFAVVITSASINMIFQVIIGAVHIISRNRDGDEILGDWETEYRAWKFQVL
ncbi:hypothetical protein GOBAR_DD22482 [Gossypium barbadense]|nr:hypothetical protein GOBAR_DD22482 [Gossypium barbadense]